MMEILLATQNKGKIKEIQEMLSGLPFTVIVPDSDFDVEETGTTFEENARLKAKAFSEQFGNKLALADDSGLVVDALEGRPGVYSKRYGSSDQDRNTKLLSELEQIDDEKRSARFISVIALFGQGIDEVFEGRVEGKIAKSIRGNQGFGYDPIFIPEGYEQTFGELGSEVKNTLSHRAMALKQVLEFLTKQDKTNRK
jgi:XTP/dITP diphosphohydrolase